MKFQAEVDLVETLKTSIRSIYQRTYIQIFDEVSLGYGIADIVVSELKKDTSMGKDLEPPLDILDINIYSLVQKLSTLTFSEIVNTTRCSKQTISKSLCKLLSSGYVLKDEDRFVPQKQYELPFRTNFAIEAKLTDWRRALKQAYRYRWFADFSFVVLDTHNSKAAVKNIDLFIKFNVGLASISIDGVLKRHFNPVRQQPFDLKMQILFSEKIKSHAFIK